MGQSGQRKVDKMMTFRTNNVIAMSREHPGEALLQEGPPTQRLPEKRVGDEGISLTWGQVRWGGFKGVNSVLQMFLM